MCSRPRRIQRFDFYTLGTLVVEWNFRQRLTFVCQFVIHKLTAPVCINSLSRLFPLSHCLSVFLTKSTIFFVHKSMRFLRRRTVRWSPAFCKQLVRVFWFVGWSACLSYFDYGSLPYKICLIHCWGEMEVVGTSFGFEERASDYKCSISVTCTWAPLFLWGHKIEHGLFLPNGLYRHNLKVWSSSLLLSCIYGHLFLLRSGPCWWWSWFLECGLS